MDLSRTACALGLHLYGKPHPGSSLYATFHGLAIELLNQIGIVPTFLAVEGEGYSGKYTRWESSTHRQLTETGFVDISVLSIAGNPMGSKEPAYDSFASLSLSHVPSAELVLCCVVNERFLSLSSVLFDSILRQFVSLTSWEYGYAFSEEAGKQPDYHVLGLDNGQLSSTEHEALNAWYAAPPEVRASRIRGVYPRNILNVSQLNALVDERSTLKQFIESDRESILRPLTETLFDWVFKDPDAAARTAAKLADSGAVIH